MRGASTASIAATSVLWIIPGKDDPMPAVPRPESIPPPSLTATDMQANPTRESRESPSSSWAYGPPTCKPECLPGREGDGTLGKTRCSWDVLPLRQGGVPTIPTASETHRAVRPNRRSGRKIRRAQCGELTDDPAHPARYPGGTNIGRQAKLRPGRTFMDARKFRRALVFGGALIAGLGATALRASRAGPPPP